ncbi:MAG: hypothetical protein WD875_15155 [Pirellulales bacterium]
MMNQISYKIPDDDEAVSWAGDCPLTDWICMGTENGRVVMPVSQPANGLYDLACIVEGLGDVVNGVAFGERFAAVSTPSSISFIRASIDAPEKLGEIVATIPSGAFDVVSVGRERFLAPMGIYGLMLASLDDSGRVHAETLGHGEYTTNFYMARLVETRSTVTTVAVAGRHDGLIRLQLHEPGAPASVGISTFHDIDVVDVCPFQWPGARHAVVGLGINGELIVCDDLTHGKPVAVRIPHIAGRAYSLRRAGPHLVILTNESVHVFEDFRSAGPLLAARKLQNQDIRIRSFQNPPSEIYVAKESLLITERDGTVYVDDVDAILGAEASGKSATCSQAGQTDDPRNGWLNPIDFSEVPQGIENFARTTNTSLNCGPAVVA